MENIVVIHVRILEFQQEKNMFCEVTAIFDQQITDSYMSQIDVGTTSNLSYFWDIIFKRMELTWGYSYTFYL